MTDVAVADGAIVAIRPVYAGKALLKVKVTARPAVLSLRPSVFTPVERPRAGTAERVEVEAPDRGGRVVVREVKAAAAGTLDVGEAPIVVSGGRGPQGAGELQAPGRAGAGVRGQGRRRRLARRGRRRVAASRGSGRADGEDRQPHALCRGRHLRRDPAPRRDAHGQGHRGDQRTRMRRSSRWRITGSWGTCSR